MIAKILIFRFLWVVCALTCLYSLNSCSDSANTATVVQDSNPNIVIIYTDDQGIGDVSALNSNARIQTPNIDRIAHEGVIFTDGHSSDAVCTPSRYSLLTGRYSWRTSLKKWGVGS